MNLQEIAEMSEKFERISEGTASLSYHACDIFLFFTAGGRKQRAFSMLVSLHLRLHLLRNSAVFSRKIFVSSTEDGWVGWAIKAGRMVWFEKWFSARFLQQIRVIILQIPVTIATVLPFSYKI